MGFRFSKSAVVTMVVMMLVFSVIHATGTKENIKYEDAKETGWSKEKITEGLGLQTEEAKDAGRRATDATVDSAKSTKDKITGTEEYVADKASEVAGSAKDTSYESAQSAKDGAEYVTDAAHEATKDSAGYVQDSAYKTAESAKGGAGYVKDATYGKTQLDAKEGKGKEGGDENTLEWAKERAKKGYEQAKNVILGSGSYEDQAEL